MGALERGPNQRRDVGTGHPVINLTTAVENYEREEAMLFAASSEQEKHASGQKESGHVIWSSHVLLVPLFALDVRPQHAAAPQHKCKNPNKQGPFMQTSTGVRGGKGL